MENSPNMPPHIWVGKVTKGSEVTQQIFCMNDMDLVGTKLVDTKLRMYISLLTPYPCYSLGYIQNWFKSISNLVARNMINEINGFRKSIPSGQTIVKDLYTMSPTVL